MLTAIAQEDGALLRGRWFQLRFSQSLAGQPVRLLVRFVRPQASEEHILPAAALGRGAWTWQAPADLVRLEILAPETSAGQMRIDALQTASATAMLLGILRRTPRLLLPFLWRAPDRARHVAANEAFDLAAPDEFERFARERRRPLEPEGLDAGLLADAAAGPRLGFVIEVSRRDDLELLRRTLAAFAAQLDGGFRLLVLAPAGLVPEIADGGLGARLLMRDRLLPAAEAFVAHETSLSAARDLDADYVAPLLPGDEPMPEAVASLRAHLAAHPEFAILYADSAARTVAGGLAAQLKPDWSPVFQASADYVGRPCLVRRDLLRDASAWRDVPAIGAGQGGAAAVGHLKRLLLTVPEAPAPEPRPALLTGPAPHATLVVPTRDRVELLRRLCESLFAKTPASCFDLVVVDNGSEDPAALAYLAALDSRADVEVLRRPGPFNFSTLINAGAEAARSPVLVLLNNDCEIVEPTWLERLANWAATPDIGAVGAKLLYADGTLQHAGVALGLGGEAGHRDRKRPRDHQGNLNRLLVPHEVAAVTAACLAVRRETFVDAGGFDEAFPVAFNDIDFCLRLLRSGYRNILDPGAVLIHAESASRGRDVGARHLREAALFRERWGELLRDDPYLHPLLSTVRFSDRLG